MSNVHLPTVRPGINPNGIWVRACTVENEQPDRLLYERALSMGNLPEVLGDIDGTKTAEMANNAIAIHLYFYDGDTGECMRTAIFVLKKHGFYILEQ